MNPKYTYEQLLEKTIRAKIALEGYKPVPHKITCPLEDPESYAPCNCGATDINRPVERAIDALKL